MKKIYYLIVFLFILTSCQSIKDAGKIMRNEKVKTTDEFLVKKRKPLVLPPDYNELPSPDSVKKENLNEEDEIKKILKAPKVQKSQNTKSSVEESILNKIRK